MTDVAHRPTNTNIDLIQRRDKFIHLSDHNGSRLKSTLQSILKAPNNNRSNLNNLNFKKNLEFRSSKGDHITSTNRISSNHSETVNKSSKYIRLGDTSPNNVQSRDKISNNLRSSVTFSNSLESNKSSEHLRSNPAEGERNCCDNRNSKTNNRLNESVYCSIGLENFVNIEHNTGMQNKGCTLTSVESTDSSDENKGQSSRPKLDKQSSIDRLSIISQSEIDQQVADDRNESQTDDSTKKKVLSSSKVDSKRDLEFSTSLDHLTNDNNYVHIQNDREVSVVLNYCKNCVFKPYFRLVSVVGLRPLFGQSTLFSLSQLPLIGCILSSINIIYTLFVLCIIILGYLLQATSCYRQDGLPTFVMMHSKTDLAINHTMAPLNLWGITPPTPTLAINVIKLNKTLDRYERVNNSSLMQPGKVVEKEKLIVQDQKLNNSRDDYFKRNYFAYHNVYEIGLKNGHIALNRPSWYKLQMSNIKSVDENVKKYEGFGTNYINTEEESSTLVCSGNLFTMFLLPDLLHLSAYLFTIYLMRASEIEKTEHLLEKSFLQASQTNGWLIAHRRLVQKLRFFLYLAFAWLIISVINHLLHLLFQTIRFTILDQLTLLYHAPQLQTKLQTPLLVFTVVTLIVKDLVCSVIIASYAIHCELNISYIQNLCRSLREKKIELQEFVKGIEEARKFVHYLNHEQSLAVSLLTVSITSQLLQAFYKMFHQIFNDETSLTTGLLVSVSASLWLSKLLTPLIQASRLSSTCNDLRYIGLELRARPFGYQDTLQSELDSIVIYTCNLRLQGKIILCPIKKSFLFGLLAAAVIIVLFLGQINYF